MDAASEQVVGAEKRIQTAPADLLVTVHGFEDAEDAQFFGSGVEQVVRILSRMFDLSHLDGVTVAADYPQALRNLDRGYNATIVLTPSDGHSVGIAMTPSVLRGGVLKSHIVLSAHHILPVLSDKHEYHEHALHTLAHECAHVDNTHKFDVAFPNVLLRKGHSNALDAFKWQVILACWDEYAATWKSARIGQDPTKGYEDIFLIHLEEARETANEAITSYRRHGDIRQVLKAVFEAYGNLVKYAGYHLGNMAGQGLSVNDLPRTKDALDGHWFAPYFERLDTACKDIAKEYGTWTDQSAFEVIGDLTEEIIAEGGVYFYLGEDDNLGCDIPLTLETTPGYVEE